MKMEILLAPTSNKLMVEHAEFDESDTHVLERFDTSAGNPVKEILLKLNLPDHRSILMDSKIIPARMTTRSAGRLTAAPRGGKTGGRTGRGGGRTRELRGRDFSTIIAQQLQNLLPTILAQVGNQGNDQGINRNQNGDAVNDNIQGDVRNVIMNNDRRGCTYKEFLACHPKEYDGKGCAIVYTRWIEKMELVQDMSGCGNDQKVKYTAGSFDGKAFTWWNSQI
ncbi:hypothetical protein Tco_0222278 [Tanacetum coccineum]